MSSISRGSGLSILSLEQAAGMSPLGMQSPLSI